MREREDLEAATFTVLEELRRRLGSSFTLGELVVFYGAGTDWATDVAASAGVGTDASATVDAAFGRYAREAVDYSGGYRGGR